MFMHTDEIERLVGLAYEMETSKDKNLCLERIAELFELERAAQTARAAEKNGELDAFRYTVEAPLPLTKEQAKSVNRCRNAVVVAVRNNTPH